MKKILFIIFAISLFHQFTFGQWVLQTSGVSSALYSVQFVNVNTGWITGTNSVIIKTTNGGVNWFSQSSPLPLDRELNDIQMLNENTGYITGWTSTFLKTTNGGANWIQLSIPQGQYNAFHFINEQTGWTCAFLGVIRKTTNGGLNWDSLNTESGGPLRDIQFLNEFTGWVVGDGGYIRKTTNGGINWYFQFFGTSSDFSYNSLHFIDLNTGFVVGRYFSGVFGTTDGGNNWDTLAMIPNVRCLYFANQFTGWTGGMNGLLYKTVNGGIKWYLQNVPVSGLFNDIYFFNDSVGWAANFSSVIHTTNGGTFVGIDPISSSIPKNFILHQNFPNPFNPNTTIQFEIPSEENVKLAVFDILGKEIELIVDERLKAGKYNIVFNADRLSSGIYFYSLTTNTIKITKRMSLIK